MKKYQLFIKRAILTALLLFLVFSYQTKRKVSTFTIWYKNPRYQSLQPLERIQQIEDDIYFHVIEQTLKQDKSTTTGQAWLKALTTTKEIMDKIICREDYYDVVGATSPQDIFLAVTGPDYLPKLKSFSYHTKTVLICNNNYYLLAGFFCCQDYANCQGLNVDLYEFQELKVTPTAYQTMVELNIIKDNDRLFVGCTNCIHAGKAKQNIIKDICSDYSPAIQQLLIKVARKIKCPEY